MRAWKEDLNFHDLIMNDPEITSKVKRETLEHAFDLKRPLRNIDKIFRTGVREKLVAVLVAVTGREPQFLGCASLRSGGNFKSAIPLLSPVRTDERQLTTIPAD